ncbi:hypothetical protein [Winogradskyella sp.]|uniref:hypothetical protein n=1 Tax=Winogradskyella sp. TaxID=1883156 RepID=UPI003F6B590F
MKVKFNIHVVILLLFTLLACSSDDNNNNGNNEIDIDLVTGIFARQDSFSAGFRLGNPNVRMPLSISSTSIVAFPNPVNNFLSIEISQTNEVITDVWLVSANANQIFQDTDFDEVYNENTYTINQISQVSIQSFNDLSNTNLMLNLESFETGYYRVFIKTDQSLFWDNIYVDNDGVNITEFFDSWE